VKKLVTERRELRQLIREQAADEAAIRSQSARVAEVESDLAVLRSKGSREFRALLTKEQTERLAKFEAKMEKRVDRLLDRECGNCGEHDGEKP